MSFSKKIVAIGGGTGLYTVLMGLKRYTDDITAVVSMADDGGSSGRLRDEFGHLPPGDIRRSLLALSADEEVANILRPLFEYRFDRGHGLLGHSFGNLFLAALTELTGSPEVAIQNASRLLNTKGTVLPVTTQSVRLWAELEDGTLISGERNIDVDREKPELRVARVFLTPNASVHPPAAEAIRGADIVVIGPGDLYTSVIPNLIVEGVAAAIRDCRGERIYVCNVMTKQGETDGFAASDFVAEVSRYIGGPGPLDSVILNLGEFAPDSLAKYGQEEAHPVVADVEQCQQMVSRVYQAELASTGNLARHDPEELARLILQVSGERQVQHLSV